MSCTQDSTYTKTSDFIGPLGEHCDGWGYTSLVECAEKCSNNELPEGCKSTQENDEFSCQYVIWDSNTHHPPGWCQLADATCQVREGSDITEVWEKMIDDDDYDVDIDSAVGKFFRFDKGRLEIY